MTETQHLPDCMMPDGAEPCAGYTETAAELERVKAVNVELVEALKDLLGVPYDMQPLGRGNVECRHCGRHYEYVTDEPVPVDATECSDDCAGYIARTASAQAEEV